MKAREIILNLFDENTFAETDAKLMSKGTEKVHGDGIITGYGSVNGRLCFAAVQDSEFLGGAFGEAQTAKVENIIKRAETVGSPFIFFIDSAGARLEEGLDAIAGFGRVAKALADVSGVIPTVAAVTGSCPAGMSVIAEMTDFVFMTETATMSVNAPEALKAEGKQDDESKAANSMKMNTEKNGCAHFGTANDEELINKVKELIEVLPDSNLSGAPQLSCSDDINRQSPELESLVAGDSYDVKDIIKAVSDSGYFLEVHEGFAENMACGFAKFGGTVAGVVANRSSHKEGALSVKSCIKAARFVQFCDAFDIPIVSFTDTTGYVKCFRQEKQGLARSLAKLAYTFSQTTAPKIDIIINKAYGSAQSIMNSRSLGADFVYAWNNADIAALDPITCASVLYHDEIAASANQAETRKQKAEEYRKMYATPLNAAEKGIVDDCISPAETRPRIISALEMLATKKVAIPDRKHGTK